MSKVRTFFTESDEKLILEAISKAEKATSGEIRVYIEKSAKNKDPYQRAVEVFEKLKMYETEARNGILFYIATEDHKFSLIGDLGIHEKVGNEFWNSVRDHVIEDFSKGQFAKGLAQGILEAGEQLKKHFPYQKDDINELSDDISTGEI